LSRNKSKTPQRPIRTPLLQRLSDFRRGPLVFMVWLAAAAVAALMIFEKGGEFEFRGIVQPVQYEVSAACTGMIDEVLVDRFETVAEGDLIARLDPLPLEASIATTRAQIDQLSSELEAARAGLGAQARRDAVDRTGELRRFVIDETAYELDALQIRVLLETDRILLQRLALRLERTAKLASEDFAAQADLDEVRLEHREVDRRIEMNAELLARTEADAMAARLRREAFESGFSTPPEEEPVLEALRKSVRVETLRLREFELQRRGMLLRSPVAGKISRILARTGQAILPGEPVAVVTDLRPAGIVYYMAESRVEPPAIGTKVLVAPLKDGKTIAESAVLRVGSEVEALPEQLWRDPAIPEYGFPVLVAAVPGIDLVPGEPVRIRIENDTSKSF